MNGVRRSFTETRIGSRSDVLVRLSWNERAPRIRSWVLSLLIPGISITFCALLGKSFSCSFLKCIMVVVLAYPLVFLSSCSSHQFAIRVPCPVVGMCLLQASIDFVYSVLYISCNLFSDKNNNFIGVFLEKFVFLNIT